MPLQMKTAAPMHGSSALTPGNPGPGRSENIGMASSTSAMPRAICCASALRSTGKPGVATSPPIRNSHARGGLMKNALAERSVCISQRQSANETSAITPSATASAMRPTRAKRNIKLLLDRQRPGVQQRLFDRRMIEITGLKPEEEIRGDGHHRRDRAEKFQPLGAEQ